MSKFQQNFVKNSILIKGLEKNKKKQNLKAQVNKGLHLKFSKRNSLVPDVLFVWIQSKKSNIRVRIALQWFQGNAISPAYLNSPLVAMLIRGVILT